MPGDVPQPGSSSAVLESLRRWVHASVAPLYRHELNLDEESLVRGLESNVAAPPDADDGSIDSADHLHQSVGAGMVKLLREAQLQAPETTVAMDPELYARVERAVSGLDAEPQGTAGLYLQGFNRQQISALTGWSDDETRQRVHAALKSLEERLREAGIDYGAD